MRPSIGDEYQDSAMSAEDLLATATLVITALNGCLPSGTEIVLHDLRHPDRSILAIAGDVTHRRVGDPTPGALLKQASAKRPEDLHNRSTLLDDGRVIMWSSILLRDRNHTPVGALGINNDVTQLRRVKAIVDAALGSGTSASTDEVSPGERSPEGRDARQSEPGSEIFARDVDELATALLTDSIGRSGVPVSLMKKEHKVAVVSDLQDRGFFSLRNGVDLAALHLQVSRFTIYNYLKEVS
ncbi:transcriptional regulator [Rhodococcus sp. ACS1]|uniref:helix-turn-helix transcriptional regulator n=1 Tax=Rhodococcus sp. ACS1 TaxID=2028570 RepID=UPI0015C835F9|nr:PAS domain-containing protein [Rhodococcus sp. ACS1]